MRDALLEAIRREQAKCAESQTPPIRFEIEVDKAGDTIAKLSVLLNCGHKVADLAHIKRTDQASLVCSKCLLVCAECGETIEPGEAVSVDGSWYHRTKRREPVNCSLLASAEAEARRRAEERESRRAIRQMQSEIASLRHDMAVQRELSERQIEERESALRVQSQAIQEMRASRHQEFDRIGSDFTRRAREPDLFEKFKRTVQDVANILPDEDHPVIRD